MEEKKPKGEKGLIFMVHAVGYYISGRYAHLCHFIPVCGLLYHHAFEMLLKSAVINSRNDLSETEISSLLKNEYRHDLQKLWVAYKAMHPGRGLHNFDRTIERLQGFEDIRYPDLEANRMTMVAVSMQDADGPPFSSVSDARGPAREVFITLDEVDWLFTKIWELQGYSAWHLKGLGEQAEMSVQPVYLAYNRHALYEETIEVMYRRHPPGTPTAAG